VTIKAVKKKIAFRKKKANFEQPDLPLPSDVTYTTTTNRKKREMVLHTDKTRPCTSSPNDITK
jgi:hypothetical protein